MCPAGSYCPSGSGYPSPCPRGTYSTTQALVHPDNCTACDPGWFCNDTGEIPPSLDLPIKYVKESSQSVLGAVGLLVFCD